MMDGFDLNSPLVCEGIVGDGCGGGRIFFIYENKLFAHDPITKENIELLNNLKDIKEIKKRGCIVYLYFDNDLVEFDLSKIV